MTGEPRKSRESGPIWVPDADPPPPQWDAVAEGSVLAGLMLNPRTIPKIIALLCPEDFFSPLHGRIYEAAVQLHEEGIQPDPILLSDRLADDPGFTEAGGRGLLHGLVGGGFCPVNAVAHAQVVKRHARLRQAARLGWALAHGEISAEEAYGSLGDLTSIDAPSLDLFVSARALCAEQPEKTAWIVEGYLARGAITELAAKIKLGKTHFALDLVAAVLAGRTFLDRPTVRTPVVYLSEERTTTMAVALRRVGLAAEEDLYVSFRHSAPRDWPQAASYALAEATRVGAGLVVVDTLADWAGLDAEKENDAGAALLAMRPLQALAAANLAVLVLRHERKGGGQVGDSARGSSAFGGAADVLLSLQRPAGAGHENRRELTGVGRLDDIPANLTVDLVDQHYLSRGTGRRVEQETVRELLLCHLPTDKDEALTETEILALLGDEHKRTTTKEMLDSLVTAGKVRKEKGANPVHPRAFGYWQTEATS